MKSGLLIEASLKNMSLKIDELAIRNNRDDAAMELSSPVNWKLEATALAATKWKSFAGWFGLALAGQAASLQMIDAGRLIHFQHYRSVPELFGNDILALSIFGFQVVCVGVSISSRLPAIREWLSARFSRWQLILVAIVLVFSGSAVTPDVSIYSTSLVIGTLVQLVNIANIILLACAVPKASLFRLREKVETFLGGEIEIQGSRRLDRFSCVAAVWIVLLTGALSYFVYQAHPHVPDETQYIFQANYLAAGQLTVKAPLVPEAFSMYMVPYHEARWFGIFPPAWPALLVLGTLAGANWLVNPLLSGLSILFAYIFFQQLYSRRFARMVILLLCCSPWFIFMGMSYMSHISTLVFALAAAIFMNRGLRNRNLAFSLGAGIAVGIVSLIRPLDGAVIGILFGIWALVGSRTWKARILLPATLFVGTAAAASLMLPYNKFVTGNAALSPSDAYYNQYLWPNVMALGFGPERGMHWALDAFPGHSPLEAVINTALNIFQLNTELFGWGTGSLLLITLLIVSGAVSKKDLWAMALIVSIAGAYSLFWYHGGPDFGARYWFLCVIPLAALTVRGVEWMSRTVNEVDGAGSGYDVRVFLAFAMLCVMTLVAYIPWRAADKYYGYLGMKPDIQQLSKEYNFGKSLVLIKGSEHPDYQSAWIHNPLNFEGDAPIYAFDRTPEIRNELLRSYGDRQVWIVDGPTLANGEYRIERGPVDSRQLLEESSQ